jgi:uncharacterized protein YdeI (YjbR/CyaY-like superfamily)
MAIEIELDTPVISFATRDEWEYWLYEHHGTSQGIWLRLAWRGLDVASVSLDDAIDVALSYGWADCEADRLDDEHWVLRFKPRPRNARWTLAACRRAEALIECGRMRPAGLTAVERARRNGRWIDDTRPW